jgi:hypothetical protein
MTTFYTPRFSQQGRTALTLDTLRQVVPSAFATQAHDSRSSHYAYIPTSDIIEAMMREGFQPFQAKQGGSRIAGKADFTKHLIRFRHPDMTATTEGGNLPEVILINSHDGTSAYKLMAGIFRMVCSNGLIVAESTVGSLSVPHKGDIVNRVIEGSFEIVGQSRTALSTVNAWTGLTLSSGEASAFAEAAHTLRFAETSKDEETGIVRTIVDTPITAAMLLAPRRSEDQRNDLYTVMNRVQENAMRGGLTARAPRRINERRGRMVTTREVRGIDQDVKLNRALWTLAERMAELKGVAVAA